MTNEHTGICIYEKGRFELRETDNAIIDLKGDFPPIMIASNTVDDGSEPNCADTRGVLHLLNELSDNNLNEERHWYLKKMLDKAWKQYHEQKEENEQLKQQRERYKRLSEIREEEINNRILTIKEFIDDYSDDYEKKVLWDLFHSEVKEYDLSKKYRDLKKENEKLGKELNIYKYANNLLQSEVIRLVEVKSQLEKKVNALNDFIEIVSVSEDFDNDLD